MDSEQLGTEVVIRLSYAEAVALHEVLAYSEWAGTREGLEFRDPAEGAVLDRLQMTLAPLIHELGTDRYRVAVESAWDQLRPAP